MINSSKRLCAMLVTIATTATGITGCTAAVSETAATPGAATAPGTTETKKMNHTMRDVQLSSPITLSTEERTGLKQLIATDAEARAAFAPKNA